MPHFCGRTHARRERRDSDGISYGAGANRPGQEPVTGASRPPTQEEIARLAYSYWEARGCPQGSAWEDWFRAERALKERDLT